MPLKALSYKEKAIYEHDDEKPPFSLSRNSFKMDKVNQTFGRSRNMQYAIQYEKEDPGLLSTKNGIAFLK